MPLAPADEARWLRLVEKTLAGKPFESLIARTDDGLGVHPLYARSAAGPIPARVPGRGWSVIQRIDHPDPAAANAQAREDVDGGAAGFALVLQGAPAAYGFGISDLRETLTGLPLERLHLRIEAGPYRAGLAADQATALLEEKGLTPAAVDISFGFDPLGDLAASGTSLPDDWETVARRLAQSMKALGARGFVSPILRADGRIYHAAGASEAQELAATLATALAYLRALDENGVGVEDGLPRIALMLTADADHLLTTAKFRAMRLLWARLAEDVGAPEVSPRIEAETAWRDLSRRDPWTNLLRTTIAALSAGIAGADAVTALPFTQAIGLPEADARRLARNTHLILMEESGLSRITDPAAGSGAFESLTETLAEKAWDLFREIERQSGMLSSLSEGRLQAAIAETRTARATAIATRKRPLIGTSVFPHLAEKPVSVLLPLPSDFATPTQTIPAGAGPLAEPLPIHRLSEPFERLRDRAEAFAAETGTGLGVFLVTFGLASAWGPRAAFARGFFEAGGLRAVGDGGFDTLEAAVEAFKTSGVQAACLCSSDELYAASAEPAARALRAAGARLVLLAGPPPAQDDAWRGADLDGCVYSGLDVVAALTEIQSKLGAR